MLNKLKSRKFLMTLLSVVVGVLSMFGVAEGTVEMVSSIGMVVIPSIIYVITEGKIDAANIKKITETIDKVVDVLDGEEGDK